MTGWNECPFCKGTGERLLRDFGSIHQMTKCEAKPPGGMDFDALVQIEVMKLVKEHQLSHAKFTEAQLVDTIRQMLRAGDFVRYVTGFHGEAMFYYPFKAKRELEREIHILQDHLTAVLAQACGEGRGSNFTFDSKTLSAYQNALAYCVEKGLIGEHQVTR